MIRIVYYSQDPLPSRPEGAQEPNTGNLGADDLYGYDEKD